ncbi:MAG: Crp/Fnr family transcriptional regulator [Blautia sp.]|jgi:CRP-like cAMP-binding protein
MDNFFWSYMQGKGKQMLFAKGSYIYQSINDDCNHYVFLLDKGICALTSLTEDGQENIYLYFRPRRIIAFNQFMITHDRVQSTEIKFSIAAKTDCTVYAISRSVFREMLTTDMEFNSFVMQTLSENYLEVLTHLHWTVEKSAISKLCYLLLEIGEESNGKKIIPKFFTYEELAKYLGTHPVTVSRIMTKLKKLKYIKKVPRGLSIENEAALWSLIESGTDFKY